MILVTGTSGFIGKKLLTALVREYGADHILAFTSKPTSECRYVLHNDYNFESDYLLRFGYSRISTIIHAGAFTPKNVVESNDLVSCTSNISNTLKLLQLKLPELKKIIFLSTLDVYGKSDVINEQSLVQPNSIYGHSKLYCEEMIHRWAKTNHKVFHLLRVGHIYGPGEEAYQKLIPATIKKLLGGQPLQVWGTGNEIRSFLFIDDLILAILKALKFEVDLGIINLVSGSMVTVRELVDILVEISGINASIDILPMTSEGKNLVFDNSKMKMKLGNIETPLRQGLVAEWKYMARLQ